VVPVAVLVPGVVPDDVKLHLAPPQEPAWWIDPIAPVPPVPVPPVSASSVAADLTPGPAADFRKRPQDATPTLFDEPDARPAPSPSERFPSGSAAPVSAVPAVVVKSAAYAAQKKVAGRVSVTDDQIRGLLDALLAAPGQRLVPALAAAALAVSPVALRGAILHAQRLLNVEGYPVLRVDADGVTVILDEGLLHEQFGIRA
jgi:hypothetical protein